MNDHSLSLKKQKLTFIVTRTNTSSSKNSLQEHTINIAARKVGLTRLLQW